MQGIISGLHLIYKYGSPYVVCPAFLFAFLMAFSASRSSIVLSSLEHPNGYK